MPGVIILSHMDPYGCIEDIPHIGIAALGTNI
jgi:hypothetical protein